MGRTVTVDTLISRIRARGECPSTYVSDAQLIDWINGSYQELYDMVCSVNPDGFVSTKTLTIVSGTGTYTVDTSFYHILGVDIYDGNKWRNVDRFNFSDRNRLQSSGGDKNLSKYRQYNEQIIFEPTPSWNGTARIWYTPSPSPCTATSDSIEGYNGWEEYIVSDCLIKIAAKEESDPSVFIKQKDDVKNRIIKMASMRDRSEPDKVRDVEMENGEYYWPSYWNP